MDQKRFLFVAGVILPLVHRGQRRRVLIAGGNGATVYVAERTAIAGAVAYRETHAAGNRANPQGCQAPSFREGCLMGPKCADSCHAGRPQAAILWFHRAMSPPPEIDDFAPLEANCSIFEQQPRPKPETAHSQSRWGLDRWTAF